MKRLLALAVAIAAVSIMAETKATAQGYSNGYQFGAGVRANCGIRSNFASGYTAREQLPYFAKFPPVYYSHIVKRPYGVSPYAAPAGIAPVELNFAAPVPVTVKNPFFEKKVLPVKAPEKPAAEPEMKSTWIANPFLTAVAKR